VSGLLIVLVLSALGAVSAAAPTIVSAKDAPRIQSQLPYVSMSIHR